MKEMAKWLGMAVVLACLAATPAVAQRMNPGAVFDLDSLTCAETDIVEGTLAGVDTAGKTRAQVINFEITLVHKGALQPGQVIPVAFVHNYMKNTRGFRQPLDYGAKLILFLTKGPSLLTLDTERIRAIPRTLLPRPPYSAEYYWIAPSGMRWVDEDGVKSFSSPGGALYELLERDREKPRRRFLSLKEFRLELDESIRKTKGLADCLYFCPEPPDPKWMLELLHERAQDMDPRMDDIIVPLMAKRMIKANDLETLDAALLIPLPDGSFPFSRGFATPEGREYLCQKLNNAQTPAENKLRYAHALLGAAPLFQPRAAADDEARAAEFRRTTYQEYLSLLACQARNQSKDEAVSLELVAGLHRTEWYLTGGKKQEVNVHLRSELAALRELYFATGSEAVKYEVERITAKADRASYNQLESRCHSIISTLKPGQSSFSGDPVENGVFKYTCEYTVLDSVEIDKAWIVLDNLDTHQAYVLPLGDVSQFKKPVESNFSTTAAVPENFEHGKYRGHLEFEKEGEIISVGHGFEAQL